MANSNQDPSQPTGQPLWERYFACFNRAEYYEAHEALEELWLPLRGQRIAAFYQGLIQLAGAFVHLQRHSERYPRLRPAAALLSAARAHLAPFQPREHGIELAPVLELIDRWLTELNAGQVARNPWTPARAPRLRFTAGA